VIQELTITNYALIEKVRVGFAPGFNVLTGETGAGKSILIGALGLLLGNRADAEVIRTGADEAQVSGVIACDPSDDVIEWLGANEMAWPVDEPLVLKRSVRPQKRGVCSVGGQPVTRTQLEELTGFLVDLHGQHEHQSLFTADQHRRLLDRYAGLEADLKVFAGEFQTLTQAKRQLEDLLTGEADREQELFRLAQVIQDIERGALKDPDEEDELKAERTRLEQFGKLSGALETLQSSLTEGRSSAVAQLKTARQALGAVVLVDDRWGAEETRLENALIEVEDIAETLHRYKLGLSFSPERLEDVNDRLAVLHGLDKRYGPGFDAVHQTLVEAQEKRARLENYASEREKAEGEVLALEQKLIQSAVKLSDRRQEAARRLEAGVKVALGDLGMRGAVFKIGFQRKIAESGKPVCTPHGIDQIEFLLAANQGESPKLLRETASGGELSRVMLALKSLLSEADKIPILIFDEIDTGIGGEIGLALGKYLKRLSRTKQVLCITHLASIASFADHHLRVEKAAEGGRTTTGVSVVEGEARVREVARMLSGASVSEASLQHARELIGRHGAQG
jgi:DNA repair protein RecN (Recombination protein N)